VTSKGITWTVLRGVAALALTVTALLLLRETYTCVIPTGSIAFFLFCVLFFLGFVGLISEVTWAFASRSGVSGLRPRIATIVMGLAVYATLAGIAWMFNPVPSDQEHDAPYRATLSIFWSAGFLQEAGALSDYACGY
jgi:hypothetical protein